VWEMKLETERLILRKPKKSDWRAIYENVDLNVIKNFTMPYPYKQEHAKYLINDSLKEFGKKSYNFIIELKKEKVIIGMAGIKEIKDINKNTETSLWLGKKYQNRGYGTEAKIAINDFAFNKLNLRKLKSEVIKTNKISNLIQKKLGYALEGTKRKECFNPATKTFVDMNLYSIFKKDWKKISPKLKRELKEKIKN